MLCLGAVLLGAADSVPAAEYYVDPAKGDDTAAGSVDAPWQHLHHADNLLQPGDTLFLRGGTYRGDYIFTVNAGTREKPIRITAYRGEEAILTGTGKWDQIFHLNNDHYVIEGLRFEETAGYNVIVITNASHVVIRGCRFHRHTGSMINVRGGGYHTIERNTFDTTGSPAGGGSGDHIYVAGSHHNLIRENRFLRAGHAACDQIEFGDRISHHNVLRNNVVQQHWGGGFYVIRGSHRSLLEHNRIEYVGEKLDYPKAGFQLAGCDNIVRRNLVLRTSPGPHKQNGIDLSGYRFSGIDQHAVNNAVYHNVLYQIGRTAIGVTQRQACRVTRNHVFNNIIYRGRVGGPAEPWWPDGNYYLTFETYHAFAGNKWTAFPNDNFFHHNLILHAGASGDRPGEDPLVFYEQDSWGHSLAWVQEKYPKHFYKNLEKNPQFVDAERGDFHLRAGSPAIDAGDFLTRTTAAGSNTATVPVGNASLFCDGWGIIEGDLVQVGRRPPARVVSVDERANTLTFQRPLTFAAGEPVSLPWQGAAPDPGAFELGNSR